MIDRNELRKFIEPYYVDKDIMHNMWHIGQSGDGSLIVKMLQIFKN